MGIQLCQNGDNLLHSVSRYKCPLYLILNVLNKIKTIIMKAKIMVAPLVMLGILSLCASAQTKMNAADAKHLYVDVHQLEPGKVKFEDVAAAHLKDLAVEKKYGVHFINYLVDEEHGMVYCLSSAGDPGAVSKVHGEAHGLLPTYTLEVTEGQAAAFQGSQELFLDIHKLGPGNVTAAAVADAHKKDLAVQGKYGVNFINYWVDEKTGMVLCLSEAGNAESVIGTHKEAHGLVPVEVRKVKRGQ